MQAWFYFVFLGIGSFWFVVAYLADRNRKWHFDRDGSVNRALDRILPEHQKRKDLPAAASCPSPCGYGVERQMREIAQCQMEAIEMAPRMTWVGHPIEDGDPRK